MIRTQIYIPEDLYNELKLLAATRKKNFSQLIREGAEKIVKRKINVSYKNGLDPWDNFIGVIKTKKKTDAVKDIRDYYKHHAI